MTASYFSRSVLGLLCCFLLAGTVSLAADLDQVLREIDRVGDSLKSMTATIEQKKWTDILDEYDSGERGTFSFLREGDDVLLRKEISSPSSNVLVIRDGKVVFYQPMIKQAQEYSLGKSGDKAEFLLLGFGSDREALSKTYEIEYLGEEQLEGRTTHKLLMKPRSGQVAAFFVEIMLWIDDERWIPIQQRLTEPTQDHLLIRFSDLRLNPGLKKSDFDLKLPKGVRVIRN